MLFYDITDFLILFISCVGIFLASAYFFFYTRIQGLKKSPGDIYLGMCCGELIFMIHAAIYSIINLQEKLGYDQNKKLGLCYTNLICFTYSVSLIYAYTIQQYLFMIFKLLYSLQTQKIKNWVSHALTWLFALLFTGTSILTYDLYGCGRGSLTKKAPYTYIIMLFSFYAMAVTTRLYIRDQVSQHSGEISKRHGLFFQEYISRLFSGQAVLMTGFILFSMVVYLLNLNEEKNNRNYPYAIEIITCLGELCAALYPVVVPVLRFTDPFLRKNLKEYYVDKKRGSSSFNSKEQELGMIAHRSSLEIKLHKYLLEKRQIEQENSIQDELKKSSLSKSDAPQVFISVTDPFIEQFQLSRRSEIIEKMIAYILISEKIKKGKIQLKDGITIQQKNEDDMMKEKIEFTVLQKIFEQEFQKQFADKVNKKYYTKALTMSSHNPALFQILIKKDVDQLNIEDCLDLTNNEFELKKCAQGKGGKSGEFFFFNYNNKLLLKTVTPEELQTLTSILESYFWHCEENPNTLIAKIIGIYTFEGFDIGKTTLIMMKNITKVNRKAILRIYDLKGSTFARKVLGKKKESEKKNQDQQENQKESQNGNEKEPEIINPNENDQQISPIKRRYSDTLKDEDFKIVDKQLMINKSDKQAILKQLNIDTIYLKQQGFMDYSLCIVIVDLFEYFKAQYPNIGLQHFNEWIRNDFKPKQHCYQHTEKVNEYYHIGIIDYLQIYNYQKMTEKIAKKVIHMNINLDTSSQDPKEYRRRFLEKMSEYIDGSKLNDLILQ